MFIAHELANKINHRDYYQRESEKLRPCNVHNITPFPGRRTNRPLAGASFRASESGRHESIIPHPAKFVKAPLLRGKGGHFLPYFNTFHQISHKPLDISPRLWYSLLGRIYHPRYFLYYPQIDMPPDTLNRKEKPV